MGQINLADTAFMFVATVLVQFMTPGLAFFYGGLVKHTNVLTIVTQNLKAMGLVFVLWYVVGFSMAFGHTTGGIMGDPFQFFCLRNVSPYRVLEASNHRFAPGTPGLLFAVYQGMFAVITPSLMTGAFVDRFRLKPYLIFLTLWSLFVYFPVTHWIWGEGFMAQWGVHDFAGGIVVHTSSAFSAIPVLLLLGPRYGKTPGHEEDPPHSVPLVVIGTAILWFGWFGFNGGSALASGGVAVLATANSQIAAAVAMLVWQMMDYFNGKTPGLVGACVGVIAGLATVTPAAGYIQTWGAVVIGFESAIVCWICLELLKTHGVKFGIDDALDVWPVHGMGGFTGSILVGALSGAAECAHVHGAPSSCANPGSVTRSLHQVWIQFWAACIVAVYSMAVSSVLIFLISLCMKIRPTKDEVDKLDEHMSGETAYSYQTFESSETDPSETKRGIV